MSKSFSPRLLTAAIGLAVSTGVSAQLEEVIVTAQKREQSVQDVPIAISAFSADAMKAKGITEVSQLAGIAPNVILDTGTPFSGSTNTLAAYIRGIGQNDFAFNFDPGVGIYVDGVYLARTVGANVDLQDVERIEILKGPQGTLFGRNSVGGAISIVTKDPVIDEFSFEGEVSVGSYDRTDVAGFANIPLNDRMAATVAFSSKQRDGFLDRVPYPGAENYIVDGYNNFSHPQFETSDTEGGQDEWVVRAKLKIDINDDMTLTLGGDMNNVDSTQQANKLLDVDTTTAFGLFYNLCINTPVGVLDTIGFGPLCSTRGAFDANGNNVTPQNRVGYSGYLPQPIAGVNVDDNPYNDRLSWGSHFVHPDKDKTYATGNSFSKFDGYGLNAIYTWDISDSMEFKSITAYREMDWDVGMDLDGSPLDMLHTSFIMDQEQFSQEFQLNGVAMDDKLTYAMGLYWFEEEGILDDFVTFPAGLLQIYGPNDLWTEAWAVFANFNYQLTERLDITIGGRYTEESKEFEGYQSDLNGFNYKISTLYPVTPENQAILGFPVEGDPLRYFPKGKNDQEFDDFSPRVAVNYALTDDMNVYASVAKGFKSGSWTTRLSNPLDTAPAFNQEEAWSYELGIKSELLDRRLRINGAVFFTEYEDIQLNFQEGISPTFRNAGDAEIKGFDIDLNGYITDNFSFTMALGYVDAEYTEVLEGAGITEDFALPKTPEWQVSIGPRYQISLGNGGTLTLNLDYRYQDELYNDTENSPELIRDSISVLNGSVTYTSPDENYDIILGGTNLTDERYLITGQAQRAGGQIYGSYNRPEEYYLTFRYRN